MHALDVRDKPQLMSKNGQNKINPSHKTYDVGMKCAQEKFDPVENLIQLFHEGDLNQKIDICKTLLSYMAPKVRSVVFSGDVKVTHEQIMKGLTEPPIKQAEIIEHE